MKKTPLQKLIDEAENTLYGSQLRWLRAKATELLEEEKQMVVDAYHTAQVELLEIATKHISGVSKPNKEDTYDAEQYFKEKYQQ